MYLWYTFHSHLLQQFGMFLIPPVSTYQLYLRFTKQRYKNTLFVQWNTQGRSPDEQSYGEASASYLHVVMCACDTLLLENKES